jgi:hypothetical protein
MSEAERWNAVLTLLTYKFALTSALSALLKIG